MKSSIEVLIKNQEDTLKILADPIMHSVIEDFQSKDLIEITKDTIEILNMTRKHFGNLKIENYIVSMNASDYNQFLEFKKFQVFKKKMDEQNEILMKNNNPVKV